MSVYLWDPIRTPRVLNQHFGLGLNPEEIISSLISPFQRNLLLHSGIESGPVTSNKEKFEVSVDVQHFAPDELNVKISGNTVCVEGKHEEKRDEHGYIFRHFVRKYVIPDNHDLNQVQSSLSSDGVLTISVPKKETQEEQGIKQIPIIQTGLPSTLRRQELIENAGAVDTQPEINMCAVAPQPVDKGEKIIPVIQEGKSCTVAAQPETIKENVCVVASQPIAEGEKIIPITQEGNACAVATKPENNAENVCAIVSQQENKVEKITPVTQEGNASCTIAAKLENTDGNVVTQPPVNTGENPGEKIIPITQE